MYVGCTIAFDYVDWMWHLLIVLVWIVLVDMLKRRWSINYTLINLGKVAWYVQAKGRIRIDCICVAFCICGFVCKWLYIPALYNRLGFSVSMTTSLLVDCYSVYATTSIFHFPERCGDPSVYLFHHDRILMAWQLIWYYLIALYMFICVVTGQGPHRVTALCCLWVRDVYYDYTR